MLQRKNLAKQMISSVVIHTRKSTRPDMKIGYIVHNLNDAAVNRRARMFEIGGAKVAVAGFCRDEQLSPQIAARSPLLLGGSQDAALLRRAASAAQRSIFNRELREFMADADVIVARNLEQLAIARVIVGARPLIYECLDIHRLLVSNGVAAILVQQVEASLLPRCSMLLTSSPAFLERHFSRRPFRGTSVLVENKLLTVDFPSMPEPRAAAPDETALTIGWFGMLRCRKSLNFLQELVRKSEGRVNVLIAGKPSPAELPDLESVVAATPGMRFVGSYSPDDLADLYGQCHFAWTIDWFEEGLNSSWLLPNRLYEAIAFGAVPIALSDIEVGRWLRQRASGLTVTAPEDVFSRLENMEQSELLALQSAVRRVDRREVLCGREDCTALVSQIQSVTIN